VFCFVVAGSANALSTLSKAFNIGGRCFCQTRWAARCKPCIIRGNCSALTYSLFGQCLRNTCGCWEDVPFRELSVLALKHARLCVGGNFQCLSYLKVWALLLPSPRCCWSPITSVYECLYGVFSTILRERSCGQREMCSRGRGSPSVCKRADNNLERNTRLKHLRELFTLSCFTVTAGKVCRWLESHPFSSCCLVLRPVWNGTCQSQSLLFILHLLHLPSTLI
jgi:hypothetical protein